MYRKYNTQQNDPPEICKISFLSNGGRHAIRINPRQIGISSISYCGSKVRGTPNFPVDINEHIGIINERSIILAPIMLPIDRLLCFLAMAVIVVTSSGREVPMAIIVSPITLSDTPNAFAISVPDSTKSLAPTVMAAALSTNNDEFIKTCF